MIYRQKNKLSVIIPFAQEHPQVAFTVQAIYCELRGHCDFEIIVIDNYCTELQNQLNMAGQVRDNGSKYLSELATPARPWLKYVTYDKKLSHWNAKNAGVAVSDGKILWFVDAHCVPSQGSLRAMYSYYVHHGKNLNGTLHMPISYMLEKPGGELQYKLDVNIPRGVVGYSFTPCRAGYYDPVYSVPCMSTCGMMMFREIYDKLGGWPEELGIYGGGEHFINFSLAVMGMTINIFPSTPLYHYAAPRGYHWNYMDYHRNRTIATRIFAGEDWAERYAINIKGPHEPKRKMLDEVLNNKSVLEQARHIALWKTMDIEDWIKLWS